jgi:peptidyl-prolyl cis-trans isomerase D
MLKYFRNRKSIGWLVGAFLLILVIFAFVAFYVPDFMSDSVGGGSRDVAWVEGSPIASAEFLQTYRAQENQYRAQLGAQFSPDLMRQLGFDNLVVQELIRGKMLSIEAERQGLGATDEEVSELIMTHPSFQTNGQFMGREAYLNLLSSSARTPASFEAQLRQNILRQKLQNLVTDGVIVSEADVREEYLRRNEEAHLEYVFVASSDFEEEVEVSEEDLQSYFEANKLDFARPVQRKVRFITLTPQIFVSAITVNDREIERYYNQNLFRYETPDQVGTSHILFETSPDTDEDALRKKAEGVLARAKAGEDFAELAREFSDDTSGELGGDLGLFPRGQMVPEFEQAAFSMSEGQISDLVQTTYGLHIIKVTSRQESVARSLESVKEEVRSTITQDKARQLMEDAIASASTKVQASGNIDALSTEYPLLVPQETPFFGLQDRMPQLENSPEAARAAFDVPVGSVTPIIRLGNGYAFLQVIEERPAGIPQLDEVTGEVEADLRGERVMELAERGAAEIRNQLAEGSADIELEAMKSFFRESQLPDAGPSGAVAARVFQLAPSELSEPIPAGNGYVVLRVLERSGFSEESYVEQKEEFEEQILSEQRLRIWNSFIANLQSRYAIEVDWQAIRAITG